MLSYGRVFDEADRAASGEGVRELTWCLKDDQARIVSLVPIRDGLLVAYKR